MIFHKMKTIYWNVSDPIDEFLPSRAIYTKTLRSYIDLTTAQTIRECIITKEFNR